MCLAIPAEINELLENDMARCRVGKSDTFVTVSTMLLESPPAIGEFIIVHAGFALRKLDPAEAQESLRLLRQMVNIEENLPGGF